MNARYLNSAVYRSAGSAHRARGFSLIEILIVLAASSILILSTSSLLARVTDTQRAIQQRNVLLRDATFAMQRMTLAVGRTNRLMLPLGDKSATTFSEHIREQTVPASLPEVGSTLATAVLAVTLDPTIDIDGDGFFDADNDEDGRIDEDWPADVTNDGASGIIGIDDTGNGTADEIFNPDDDDEYLGLADEDPVNSSDDDLDGTIDEDSGADMNADNEPGEAGVDDDGDGSTDEGDRDDDDEDGAEDEDWLDIVAFYLNGSDLVERTPVPWDTNSDTAIDGKDFIETVIASSVTRFRVERRVQSSGGETLIDLTLELTDNDGESVSLNTRVRVGGIL